jgi:precorrin-6B methylase 2
MSVFTKPIRTLRALRASATLLAGSTGYLASMGWFRSMVLSASVNGRGEPIPWITYPSIRFVESRLRADMSVFEFGSGASTLWWAKRVRRVVSCEHDRQWYEQTRVGLPANVELIYASRENHEYSRQVLKFNNEFDVIVIDGRDRVRCAQNCVPALKAGGVILWDNTDRDHYQRGFDHLRQEGFRRVDFSGMGPIVEFECMTSLFYRDGNCLGL